MTFLQQGIEQNYSITKAYYTAKRQQLEEIYTSKMISTLSELESYIGEIVEEYQENISEQVYAHLNLEGGAVTSVTLPDIEVPLAVTTILEKITKSLSSNKMITRQNVGALLGNEFEHFVTHALQVNEFTNVASGVASELADRVIETLAQGLNVTHTGQVQAVSAVTKGAKNIRPDIGLGFSREQMSGVGVELEQWLDVSDFVQTGIDSLKSQELIKNFLQSNSFGLSLKIWNADNSNKKKFSDSVILQEKINNQLLTYSAYGNRTTWESLYAMDYINYQISRYLINIISPLNVAVVTGSGLIWMDDFLSTRIFYMDVQLNSKKKSTRGAGWEGFPEIISPGIFIRQVAKDKIQSLYDYNVFVSKTGRITMKNRKIIANI